MTTPVMVSNGTVIALIFAVIWKLMYWWAGR